MIIKKLDDKCIGKTYFVTDSEKIEYWGGNCFNPNVTITIERQSEWSRNEYHCIIEHDSKQVDSQWMTRKDLLDLKLSTTRPKPRRFLVTWCEEIDPACYFYTRAEAVKFATSPKMRRYLQSVAIHEIKTGHTVTRKGNKNTLVKII